MQRKQYKILHLDDEDSLRAVVALELECAGYEAHSLDLKHEGLEWILENKPDLVISDIKSPDLDGITFLRMLRADPRIRDTKVMLLTGVDDLAIALEAVRLGVVDYVTKPYDLQNLLHTIERIFQEEEVSDHGSS